MTLNNLFSAYLVLFAMTISSSLFAGTFTVEAPCQYREAYSEEFNKDKFETAGDVTIHMLTKSRIPFQGTERGINQIFSTQLGLDALEVVSDEVMYAYGWCYTINNEITMSYADEVYLDDYANANITWFYGISKFDKDKWVSMCQKATLRKDSPVCQKLLNR